MNELDIKWEYYLKHRKSDDFKDMMNFVQNSSESMGFVLNSHYFGELFSKLRYAYECFLRNEHEHLRELQKNWRKISNTQKTAFGAFLCDSIKIREVFVKDLQLSDINEQVLGSGINKKSLQRVLELFELCDSEKLKVMQETRVPDLFSVEGSLMLGGTSVYDACFVRAYGKNGLFFILSVQSPMDAIFFPKTGLIIKSNRLRYEVVSRAERMIKAFVRDLSVPLGWDDVEPVKEFVNLVRDKRPYHVMADELSGNYYLNRISNNKYPLAFLGRSSFVESLCPPKNILSNDALQKYASDKILFSAYKRVGDRADWSKDYCDYLKDKSISLYSNEIFQKKEKDVIFWIGIAGGEKRAWKEELDGLEAVIKQAIHLYPGIRFVFDGWTGTISLSESDNNNISNHNRILAALVERCGLSEERYKETIGSQILKKVALASQCDFFVACAGTPAFWPSKVCRVPGLVHNSTQMIHRVDNTMNINNVVKVADESIVDITDGMSKKRWDFVSYSIDTSSFVKQFVKAASQVMPKHRKEEVGCRKELDTLLDKVSKRKATKIDYYNAIRLSVFTRDAAAEEEVVNAAKDVLQNYRNLDHLIKSARFFGKPEVDVLHELEGAYRIIDCNAHSKSDVLFITFGKVSSNVDHIPFAYPFLVRQGYRHIHVAQARRTSYQELTFESFRDLITPHIRGAKVVFTYGTSLGGYAAIYYSGAINGYPIAGSPRLPIHPENQRFKYTHWKPDSEWDETAFKHQPLAAIDKTSHTPFLIYDPLDVIDQSFVSNVLSTEYDQLRFEKVAGSRRGSLHTLSKEGRLKPLISNYVDECIHKLV